MTRQSDDHCMTPDGSVTAGNDGPTPAESSVEARALEHAEKVPTPPTTPSGQRSMDGGEVEIDISSPQLRLFTRRLYIALPDVRPPSLDEEEISDIIQHLQTDLTAAYGKIKAKSHRKPPWESTLMIDMRMSGTLEDGSTKVKLKPCIWLFCGSRWCRKIVEKDIKKLNWCIPCGMHIVDKGGPLLAASDDSSEDECRGDHDAFILGASYAPVNITHYAADFEATSSTELQEPLSDRESSGSHCPSLVPSHGVVASTQPSIRSTRTDVYNTVHRRGRPTSPYILPCEFAILTDCDTVFLIDETDKWVEHTKTHLNDVLPRKLRCWYCVDRNFDADQDCDGNRFLNFGLRMSHIRDHVLHDGSPASWARPDQFVINHLKIHRLVDEKTWNRLATQNTVLSGPGCLATRIGPHVGSETSLKLLDDTFLDFHVQESYADSCIGLTCRSTIRRNGTVISETFSRMGGVITVTRASGTTLYGVTSGHGLVCQILEHTSKTPVESVESSDGSSESSLHGGDSTSDETPQDEDRCSHDLPAPSTQESVERWISASHGLVATFRGLYADSMKFGMVPREASTRSSGVAGDLALIKIPTDYARKLRNDFVDPAVPRSDHSREKGRVPTATEANGDQNSLLVLLSKTRSVTASRVPGTVHFSVGGRKVETIRVMLSEKLGEYIQ